MIGALTTLLVTCIGWIPVQSSIEIPRTQAAPRQEEMRASAIPTQPAPLPPITARNAVIIDPVSMRVLGEKGASELALQASITKLATLIESLKEDPSPVTSTEPRVFSRTENRGVQSGIQNGETITLQDAWTALLLPSANDVAEWLANLSGDRDAFLRRMVQTFGDLGITMEIANASGLDEGTVGSRFSAKTSAELIHVIGKLPKIGDLARTPRAAISPGGRNVIATSTNTLLLDGLPIYAGKTGTTDAAGQNIAVWVRDEATHALIVVLGSRDRYGDVKSLLAWTRDNFSWQDTKK